MGATIIFAQTISSTRLSAAACDHHYGKAVAIQARDQCRQEALGLQCVGDLTPCFEAAGFGKLVGAIAQREEGIV
jgi:hypothetical protein